MSILSAAISFIALTLVTFVGVLFVWCLIAGIFHGAKVVSGYLWWVGAALFWAAVLAVIYFLLFA